MNYFPNEKLRKNFLTPIKLNIQAHIFILYRMHFNSIFFLIHFLNKFFRMKVYNLKSFYIYLLSLLETEIFAGQQCTEFEKKKCGSKNLGIPRHFNDPKTALELLPRLLKIYFLFMQSFYLTHVILM